MSELSHLIFISLYLTRNSVWDTSSYEENSDGNGPDTDEVWPKKFKKPAVVAEETTSGAAEGGSILGEDEDPPLNGQTGTPR